MDMQPMYDAIKSFSLPKDLQAGLGLVIMVGLGCVAYTYVPASDQNTSLSATTALANSQGVPTYYAQYTGNNTDPLVTGSTIPIGQFPYPPECNSPGSYSVAGPSRFNYLPNCPPAMVAGVFSVKETTSGVGITFINKFSTTTQPFGHGVGLATTTFVGTGLTVSSGTTVTLQWVCQPSIFVGYSAAWSGETHTGGTLKYYADSMSGSGPGWSISGQSLYGSTTVVVTGEPDSIQNYTFSCNLTDPTKITYNTGTIYSYQGDNWGPRGPVPNSTNVTIPVHISASTVASFTPAATAVAVGQSTTLNVSTTNTAECTVTGPNGVLWSQPTTAASYNSTGALQTYTVPAGITAVNTKIWGAGGGGSENVSWWFAPNIPVGFGGGGGYTVGALSVNPGQVLNIIVGKGGGSGTQFASYGGGGGASNGYDKAGSGGGLSGVQAGGDSLYAGGGGGGLFSIETYSSNSISNKHGGAGGGPIGQTGIQLYGDTTDSFTGSNAGGGTQTGTGYTAYSASYASSTATMLRGLGLIWNSSEGITGGGGGFYGGQEGSGGSGYCGLANWKYCTTAGNYSTPANNNDQDLPLGKAIGGATSTPGGDGFVKITPVADVSNISVSTGPITVTSTYTLSCDTVEGSIISTSTIITSGVSSVPYGYLPSASCTAMAGWACQDNLPTSQNQVRVYADGTNVTGTLVATTFASTSRPDIATAGYCAGNANHGFSIATPDLLKDSSAHTLRAYVVSLNDSSLTLLSATTSPLSISGCTCGAGKVLSGGVCTCTNGSSDPTCRLAGAVASFTATQSRIRSGRTPLLTWSTTNMVDCSVKNGATLVSSVLSASSFVAPAITKTTTYALQCIDAFDTVVTRTLQVGILPQSSEI